MRASDVGRRAGQEGRGRNLTAWPGMMTAPYTPRGHSGRALEHLVRKRTDYRTAFQLNYGSGKGKEAPHRKSGRSR
jgi:hypothetical protein